MNKLFFLLSFVILISCSSNRVEDIAVAASEVPVKIIKTADLQGGEATIHIEGMSCEKMCVSKIKKTLADLEGVEGMDIDFDAERTIDLFTVQYDQDKVSEKEMIEAVQGIAGGVYKVTEVEVKMNGDVTSYNYSPKPKKKRANYSTEKVEDRSFKMPSIFDALKKFSGIR